MATGTNQRVATWKFYCRSLREQQTHGTWFTTSNKEQESIFSLPAYAQLTQPVVRTTAPSRTFALN